MTAGSIGIFSQDEIPCALKFEGNNTIGNPQVWTFPRCSLTPSGSIDLLSDGWQDVTIEAEVLNDPDALSGANSFGTIEMADTGETSPATSNYSIGKGELFIVLGDNVAISGAEWVSLGNCNKISFKIDVTKLDHFSSMAGVKTKDKTVITERSATISFTPDEITGQNLALAVMGSLT